MQIPPISQSRPADDPSLKVSQYIEGMEKIKQQLECYVELHPNDPKGLEQLTFVENTLKELRQLNPNVTVPPEIEQSVVQKLGPHIKIVFP